MDPVVPSFPSHVVPPGKKIDDIDCTPYTELLESERAEVPDTIAAVLELVDNPIEELLKSMESGSNRFDKSHPLRVDVFVHDRSINQVAPIFQQTPGARPVIVVQDNAGGVERGHFSRLFRFGEAGELADHGISAYGRGGKRARLKLGNRHVVVSRRGEKQHYGYVIIRTGQNTDWKVPIFESKPTISEGTTRVAVDDLLFSITLEWINHLREQLTITYSKILGEGRAEIWLNGTRIEPVSIESTIDWSGGTDIEPKRIPFSYKVPVIERRKNGSSETDLHTVNGEVTIGLLRETTTTQEWGFDIICNGRLLQRFVKAEVGFCPKERGGWGVQPSNQKISMVRGVVYLSGPSKAMPWRSNKVEFDDEKVDPLRKAIVKTCDYWINAGLKISRLKTTRISGTLSPAFKGKIRSLSEAPDGDYSPPAVISAEQVQRVAFVTTKRVVDQAKRVFELGTDRDVNTKAKDIFEEAVTTETAMYKGARASHAVDLRDLGLSSQIRTKLGMAGIQIEELKDISKREEKDAIKELRKTVNGLTRFEAKRVHRAALAIK